jgi:molybdate transport system regulatory protein
VPLLTRARATAAALPNRQFHPGLAMSHHSPLRPRIKVWLETDGGRYAFGFGIAEILRAVDRAGSIKQAAADLGQSYRHVWGLVKEAERALGRPLVETHVGGRGTRRSSLTPEARRLVDTFLSVRGHLIEVVEREFARHFPV